VTGSLAAHLKDAAATDGDSVAFVDGATRLTYREWNERSDEAASRFAEFGLSKGDVVALFLPMSVDYPVAYLGAAKAGVVTAGINTRYRSREVAHILGNSGAKLLVAPNGELRELAESVAPQSLRAILDPSELRGTKIEDEIPIDDNDPVAIVYTSGTTGLPKGATYTWGCIEAIRRIEAAFGAQPRPRVLQAVPLPHMAFMTKIASAIERRSFTVLMDRWTARGALEMIERERLTDTGGIPTQLSLMLMEPSFETFDLSSLRLITIGGAPASPDLIRRVREAFGTPVAVRFSTTEIGLATGTSPGDSDEIVATTAGRPLPEVDLRIDAPPGEIGEILVRSPAMMRGYWNDPQATAEAIDTEGFFHTGDLGRIGDDGCLRITGRAKDMYIRGGYNVYPAEVEAVLREHPGVALAAVIGVPDPVMGERGRAYVVPRAGRNPSVDELRSFLAERIADYKIPDEFEFRTELPLTPMFKVDKQALTS
jgi:acyl-CoA synthetase (AMP-forming)/AMP-acid ligase II